MNKVPVAQIRNVALVGHHLSGKTTFVEAMLFETKQVGRLAKVDDGNSNLDFVPEEIERRISIKTKLAHAEWGGHRINFVDTPGYDDFVAERNYAIAAVDAVLLFVKADAGLESGTEACWRELEASQKPRLIVVNRMDREHADFEAALVAIQKVSHKAVPAQLPIGAGADFKGFIDVIEQKAYMFDATGGLGSTDVPAALAGRVRQARDELMNAAAETSDELVEKFLETGELSEQEFRTGLASGVRTGALHPVLVAAAGGGRSLSGVLDLVVKLVPSPLDASPIEGHLPDKTDRVRRKPDESDAVCALAFGAMSEQNVGDYTFIRVYSGKLAPGTDVLNATTGKTERVGQLYLLNGKLRSDASAAGAGDICAAVKMKATHIGNTISDHAHPIVLPRVQIPAPLTLIAIKNKVKGEEDKLSNGLQRLHEEDVGFLVEVNSETHQTLLKTHGDTHQAIVLGKLKRKYHVEVETEPPRTPYRETIKGIADERYRHKKQTGGRGQFGEVHLKLEPNERGGGFEFVDGVVGGVIPGRFIPAVEKGVREALVEGVMAGFGVVDVRVTVDDGKHHAVDSSEAAFKLAAAHAFKQAFPRAKPMLLEPIYKIIVRVPEEYMGDVMADMSSRRGHIQGMETEGHAQTVRAEVPLAELYDYAGVLRSLTQGRGRHEREFSHYQEVPHEVAERIIAEHKATVESEEKS